MKLPYKIFIVFLLFMEMFCLQIANAQTLTNGHIKIGVYFKHLILNMEDLENPAMSGISKMAFSNEIRHGGFQNFSSYKEIVGKKPLYLIIERQGLSYLYYFDKTEGHYVHLMNVANLEGLLPFKLAISLRTKDCKAKMVNAFVRGYNNTSTNFSDKPHELVKILEDKIASRIKAPIILDMITTPPQKLTLMQKQTYPMLIVFNNFGMELISNMKEDRSVGLLSYTYDISGDLGIRLKADIEVIDVEKGQVIDRFSLESLEKQPAHLKAKINDNPVLSICDITENNVASPVSKLIDAAFMEFLKKWQSKDWELMLNILLKQKK